MLLPKGQYRDIPVTEEMKIDIVGTTKLQDKNEGEIQKASRDDNEIVDIKRNLDEGKEEMEGIAIGLGEGRTTSYGAKEEFGYQMMEGYERLISANAANPHSRTRRHRKHYRTHHSTIRLVIDKTGHQTIQQRLRDMSEDQTGPRCTLRITTV